VNTLPPLPDGFFVAGAAPSVPGWLAAAVRASASTGDDDARETDLSPDAALVLVGTDARAWEAFVGDLARDPAGLTGERDPFDAWVRRTLTAAGWAAFPHAWCDGASALDFVGIARSCGQDTRGLHGLLLDPVRGPWWAIRGVFVVCMGRGGVAPPQRPPATTVAPDPAAVGHPCEACIAAQAGAPPPCAAACPGGVFARHEAPGPFAHAGWTLDGRACARFHVTDTACASGCAARAACPLGREWRYPPEAVTYHANRRLGRAALRARLGIPAGEDPFDGEGPDWAAWAGG
jgi:hypothetical protein